MGTPNFGQLQVTSGREFGSVKVQCAADCRGFYPLVEMVRVRVPVGTGLAAYDPRPKTVTGGRLGLAQGKRRRFIKYATVLACARCSRRYQTVYER